MAVTSMFVAALASGCPRPTPPPSGTPSGAVCSDGSPLTYDSFGHAFVDAYCTRCHASAVTGLARNGAPVDLDFDTLARIQENADRIDAQAASGPLRHNIVMPPSDPFPTTAERTDLGVWLACGAP
jgi:uncharacterized membrane protein